MDASTATSYRDEKLLLLKIVALGFAVFAVGGALIFVLDAIWPPAKPIGLLVCVGGWGIAAYAIFSGWVLAFRRMAGRLPFRARAREIPDTSAHERNPPPGTS